MTDQLSFGEWGPHLDLPDTITALIVKFGHADVEAEVRRQHPTLVAGSAPARWSDPETSHLASNREPDVGRFSTKSRQAKLLAVFNGDDLTDQQATIRLVGSHASPSAFDGCRRRCSDLRAVHYLADSGARRRNAGSDDESIVWMITHTGKGRAHQARSDGLVTLMPARITAAQAKALGIDVKPGRTRTTQRTVKGAPYHTRCVACDEVFTTMAAETRHVESTKHARYVLVYGAAGET